MVLRVIVGWSVLNLLLVYAPQSGLVSRRFRKKKKEFFTLLGEGCIRDGELLICEVLDVNGHVEVWLILWGVVDWGGRLAEIWTWWGRNVGAFAWSVVWTYNNYPSLLMLDKLKDLKIHWASSDPQNEKYGDIREAYHCIFTSMVATHVCTEVDQNCDVDDGNYKYIIIIN